MAGTKTMMSGTPGFQAPEQLQALEANIKCDVYGVGGVLLELFGERPIWDKLTPSQIICKVVVAKECPDVSHLFPWLQNLSPVLCNKRKD